MTPQPDAGVESFGITLSVLAPCYNEGRNVDFLVDRTLATFSAMNVEGELVLVDDGSQDDTWARIESRVDADRRVRGIQHSSNGGMEAAWGTGLAAAHGRLVCLIDADLQNRPEDIARLLAAYTRSNHDLVQGVRLSPSTLTRHRLFSRGLNRLLNAAFGTSLRDNKSGFILCRREVLQSILEHRFTYKYFQSFLGVAACAHGFSVEEIDTLFEPRRAGCSFLPRFPLLPSIRIGLELLKFRFETCLIRRSIPSRGQRLWASTDFLSTRMPTQA